ncbi:hypothetical protein EPA93_10365 [Ktedonosporobacter rubrisoli]|uniref:MalT-like TPR region domain-containing protein n=1 Tax=Ktedonosporobacter rubrisoli TaxID=2509675 RepID=A0A4P6JMB6_KTERU|nr:hypothetical protein [Ktedonosporobacter rubrisoli]QBD76389.1 hypothetical protein EPA93_10365 [Ktedonosporobacter rubrisoli]
MDMLRRELLKKGVTLALPTPLFSLVGSDLLALSVEEYMAQWPTLLQDCWKLMAGKYLGVAENLLAAHINSLMQMIYSSSHFRREAAAIAVQAKILQAILALHRLDFAARKLFCGEAVSCARIAEEPQLLAIALRYFAYAYMHPTIQPLHDNSHQLDFAVASFQEALHLVDKEKPLLCSVLGCGLAAALAQQGKEKEALANLHKAERIFPTSSEREPGFANADWDEASFYLLIGRVFLDLAQRYPQHGYYEQALKTLEKSSALQMEAKRINSEIFIHFSAAASGIGDLELYEENMRKGLLLAKEVGSQKRALEAYAVAQNVPQAWHAERRIQKLEVGFFTNYGTL